ncbi:MAG: hypothetical protein AAF387_15475 [Pseudomonadota bacterium]
MSANLAKVIEQADYWRGATQARTQNRHLIPFKEWQHFVIFSDQWILVFNLNIDEVGENPDKPMKARVITIFSTAEWRGQVDRCRSFRVKRGEIDASFESAGMAWRDGKYEIWQPNGPLKLAVSLQPESIPSLTHNIPLGKGSHLSWCLVPRLRASGWVEIDNRKFTFENRLAYHDHNWGRFQWGGDFSWEWGCAMPSDIESPWAIVYARMNSQSRNAVTATSLFLLENGNHLRYFRNAEVDFLSGASKNRHIAGRIPAAAAMLTPDDDLDVADQTVITAKRGNEWLRLDVAAGTRGQVLVPSDVDYCKVVRMNEASTVVNVEGRCAGRDIRFSGPGLLEVVRV